jgi:hypothetical protein
MGQDADGSAPMLGSVANGQANLDGWIPVTERLPEDGVPVAVVADRGRTPDNRGVVAAGELYHGCWYHTLPELVVRQIADVTHWMPLPAPPTDSTQTGRKCHQIA